MTSNGTTLTNIPSLKQMGITETATGIIAVENDTGNSPFDVSISPNGAILSNVPIVSVLNISETLDGFVATEGNVN